MLCLVCSLVLRKLVGRSMLQLSKFCAKFNYAVKARKLRFTTRDTYDTKKVLDLFIEQTYVISYEESEEEKNTLIVYLNNHAINFRLKRIPRIHRRYVSKKWLRINRARGNKCIINTYWGLQFSNFSFASRRAGEPMLYAFFKK